MRKITVSIIGCGSRGATIYGASMFQDERYEIVALCDTRKERVERFGKEWGVPETAWFFTEEAFFSEKRADLLVIATQDLDHVREGIRALELGYDILMEKPISPRKDDLLALIAAQKKYGGKVMICHVLRYAPAFVKVKELLERNVIGNLRSIEATEQVGYWHYAHSFVRGNWRNDEGTSPMIMQKCCHDLDLLQYYANSKCKSVYSIGNLSYFKRENQPEGAAERCSECQMIRTCPYSAERLYVEAWKNTGALRDGWPYNTVTGVVPLTEKAIREGYESNGYGRCVFACDNNVVDNQYVTMEFENGVKANLTMTAFTRDMGRVMTFHGTLGSIKFSEDKDINSIKVQVYGEAERVFKISELVDKATLNSFGHGGGDYVMMNELYLMITEGSKNKTSLEQSVESHLIALAAEESRREHKVVFLHQ